MSTPRAQVTVSELLRVALPMGTRVIAGFNGLNRPVNWISVLHTRPPAFPSLERRELVLLSIDALHLLSDKLTLTDLINDVSQMEVAAIGVIGNVDPRARKTADELEIPVLNLPSGVSLRQIERDVVKALIGPPVVIESRGQEIHEQLLQLSTENKGLKALVAALSDAANRTVVVQDKRLDVAASAGPLIDSPRWSDVELALGSEDPLPALFRNRVEVAQVMPEPAILDLPDFGLRRMVLPIVANRMGRGFLSLVMRAELGTFDALDMQYIRHGAAICAIEMAKEKAIREAQKRVQGGVLERLLSGSTPADQALRQFERLGHQPNERLYAAVVASWVSAKGPSDRRLETTFNEQVSVHGYDALVQILDNVVVIFCAVDTGPGTSSASAFQKAMPRIIKQLCESVQGRLHTQQLDTEIAMGVGRPVNNLTDWRSSYREALAAQQIALQWCVYQPLYFADLGVYRLLSLLMQTQELRSFYREILGDLADDGNMNDEFVTTLETFFEEHGNLSQTANRLHVHRNTLLYRMERIAQIGGFDLDNPETRLAVHLALKIRRLLTNPRNQRPS